MTLQNLFFLTYFVIICHVPPSVSDPAGVTREAYERQPLLDHYRPFIRHVLGPRRLSLTFPTSLVTLRSVGNEGRV